MRSHYDILIVGAGHGGASLALNLRQRRFAGSIGVVSDELSLPYGRPPLSKDFLSGARTLEEIQLRAPAVWRAQAIDLLTGMQAISLAAARHELCLADGSRLSYGSLVWAAGGRARRLACPGSEVAGIHSIRSRADVEALRIDLERASKVVVIGAGYVGLECAATLKSHGKQVTVVESHPRVLARVTGPELSSYIQGLHAARGVELVLNAAVDGIESRAGRLSGVRLADGRWFEAQVAIVGIGMLPNVEVLAAAGAKVTNGVDVDAQCRTTLPDVFAIGDCVLHPNRFSNAGMVRLESVQNATDQAAMVSRILTGETARYDAIPWFWSQQFDCQLQTAGLLHGFDSTVVRGEPKSGAFSIIYTLQGRVLALDCVNAGRDFIQGKHLVMKGVVADAETLASTAIDLRSLVT
jgi:3-phenylpropionate/trans-cinnamate dioxygenase ferredoxin reductase subunit